MKWTLVALLDPVPAVYLTRTVLPVYRSRKLSISTSFILSPRLVRLLSSLHPTFSALAAVNPISLSTLTPRSVTKLAISFNSFL